jgi:hypothetical protein
MWMESSVSRNHPETVGDGIDEGFVRVPLAMPVPICHTGPMVS